MPFNRIKRLAPEIAPITYKDGRGVISTFYPSVPIVEFNLITTHKGAFRGGHFHNEFDEYTLMVTGGGVYVELDGDTELSETVATGDCLYIPKDVPHVFYPTADTQMVSLLTKRWNECKEPITKVESILPVLKNETPSKGN